MKLALLYQLRVVMILKHGLPVLLIFLLSFNALADCPAKVTTIPSSTIICAGDSVLMKCTDPAATSWQWYKDGVAITDSTKITCYAKEAGNYTVTTDVCNIPSAPVVVTLKPLPVISISASSTLLCSGQQVTLVVDKGPNVVWAWIAPVPIAWTNTSPLTVTLTTPTTFQLVGANPITQCANTTAVTVQVIPPLTPGSVHPSSQVCPGGIPPALTSDPATGGSGSYGYQWQISTISASDGFTDIPGATSQTYQPGPTWVRTWYRMRVSSPPCDDEYSGAIVVQVNPNPSVTSPPATSICTGDKVNYVPTSDVAGSTFTWTASVTSGTVSGFTSSGSGTIQDVLSLAPGASVSGEVTYVITPKGPAPAICPGTPMNLTVTVYPIATVTNAVLAQTICSGSTTAPVVLQSNIAGATFSWTAVSTTGLSGYLASGTGDIPAMAITGLINTPGTVTYTITPHVAGITCPTGPTVAYTITVNPAPGVTNNPLQQTICAGSNTSAVALTSNLAGTTFTWNSVTPLPAGVSGVQASGTNTIPAQAISNSSNVQAVVSYHIVPDAGTNGCSGIPQDYTVNVNPVPDVTTPQLSYTICSGNTTSIPLSSNVAGTNFSWTASSTSPITGFSDGSGSLISQSLKNTSNSNYDVTYVITPTSNGCTGSPVTVTVTVTPEQVLSIVPAAPKTCSGSNVSINLVGNVPGITFSWTASSSGNVTGFSDGTGSTISQTLTNHENVTRKVVYAVIMTLNGCSSDVTNFNVTVYPTPVLTTNPLNASLCSGATFSQSLSSNVAGSNFSWTVNSTPGISGYSTGSSATINQQIYNSTNTPGSVIYTITPSANGCPGIPSDYSLTINPVPDVNLSMPSQVICSGTSTTQVEISSAVAGTTFAWTANPSAPGLSGYSASGSTSSIPQQTINSTLSTQGFVTYGVIPSFAGCIGNTVNHVVTVNPLPKVTNASMTQTICTGATSANVNLLSNVAGTSFTWTATASSGAITGFQPAGSNTIPAQTIFNTALTPGTVTYQIIPTSNFGPACPGTPATYTITVHPLPSITSSLSEAVCSGQPFTYTIAADLAGTTFTWTREAIAGISNPPASGASVSFTEKLNNTTNSDIDVKYILTPRSQAPALCTGNPVTLTVKVRALPLVNAGADFTIPYGTYTSLNGTASGGTGSLNYSWSPNTYIGSGISTLTPQTTSLTGTRTFTCTAIDSKGCSSSDQVMVMVTGTPLAVAPISSPTEICVGESNTINANATGGSGSYTYSWTSIPAGFTSTASSITVTPSVNTQYIVTVNDGFNTTTAKVATTVNPLPLKFGLTGGGSYCSGGSGVVVGLAGSQSGVNYQLYHNGNPVGSPVPGNDASISFGNQTLPGIYTATASRASTLCSQSMGSSVSVSVNPLPVANAGADQSITYGISTLLNGSVSGGFGSMNYSWEPSTFIALGGNTSSPLTTNLYSNTTFTLKVTDANGCRGTDDMIVSLNGNAVNVTTNSDPAQICADASQTQLNAMVTGGTGTYTYSWTCTPEGSPAWTSTEQSPLVSPDVNTIYTVKVNDGFNSAIASATVVVHPLPAQFSVTGSGSYCYAGTGVNIGLSGSQTNTNYQLFRGGIADGPAVMGTGNPISFGNRTAAFTYTVVATNNITGCTNQMTGSSTIIVLPPPAEYLITGGGSYPAGGQGRSVGLVQSDAGVSYQLFCDNVATGLPKTGTGMPLDFGFQTQPGTYTVVATDLTSGCTANSLGSVNISVLPAPLSFHVTGGGTICVGEPGLPIGLTGSETGITYQLLYNGFPQGAPLAGTNLPLEWGPKSQAGLYEVRASNPSSGTSAMMPGSAVITVNQALTVFSIDPNGSQCPGTHIRLNGSEAGITYYLLLNDTPLDTLQGTGINGFLDFGPQTMTGVYTIKGVNKLTGCHTRMNGSTQILALPAIFNITPAGLACASSNIGLDGSETGVNYTLFKNGINTGITLPGTGSALNFGTFGHGTFTVKAVNQSTQCSVFMSGVVQVSTPAIVDAGSNATICITGQLNLNATIKNGRTYEWTTSGDGSFNDINSLRAIYTPGVNDKATGRVYLVLTANGTGGCLPNVVKDTLTVTIDQPATANAGNDIDFCVSGDYTLTGASATNLSSVTWLSSGTGTFKNGNTLTPTYTPSASDILSGSATLTMKVTGNSPCSNPVSDHMTLILHPAISVYAGPDATIGYGDKYIAAAASVQNSASVLWSSSGSGTFNNSSFVNATYTPSNADFAKGSVILRLTTVNNAPCQPVADELTLTLANNWKPDFSWGASCEAQPVAFSVNPTVTNVNAVASWLWNFGDGTTSTQMNPSHLFSGTGIYTVILSVTDTLGNVKLTSHPVTVSQFPVSFFKNSIPNCSNEAVHFTELAHTLYGYIAKWVWNYGDGSANDTIQFPDEPNTDHRYNAAGIFNVTLTVTNSFGCSSAETIPVTVIEAPIANFQYTEDCSGLKTLFRDASYANGPGNTVQYSWDFGDPATGTDNYSEKKDAAHIFSAPGKYIVKHVVRNFNNCTDTIVKPVTILTPVAVDFKHDPVCLNGITNFGPDTAVMNFANITSWVWDFGDGTTNHHPYTNHVFTTPGSYQVKLTVTDISGCTVSKTRTITVNQLPVAMFSVPQQSCSGSAVHFDDVSIAYAGIITSWNWDFGDNSSLIVLNPLNPDIDHTYSIPGAYTVKLTVISSDGCSAERAETIFINPSPSANFNITNTCRGTQVQFADISQPSSAGIINGWKWNFGDGASGLNNTSGLQNPQHVYPATGLYQVELTVTAANGCSSSIVKNASITDAPFVDFSFDDKCVSKAIQFTPAPGIDFAEVVTWKWSFGDGSTAAIPDPQHMYSTPGNYTVILTIANTTGCENTISHAINILPAPVASFRTSAPACSGYQVTFTDQSTVAVGIIVRWEYDFGDGNSKTVNYPDNPHVTHIYETNGAYNSILTVYTDDNCSASVIKTINIQSGPMANFSNASSCLDAQVQFNDLSQGNVISWAWDFADPGSLTNNFSNLKNPTHVFQRTGDYLVTLRVENTNGCSDTVTRKVIIAPKPSVDFSFYGGCAADTVHFNSSSYVNAATTASWQWQFGDNTTSKSADPYHIYSTPGNYNATLTITNQNGCTNVKTRQVQVTTAPTAMFTSTSLSCSGTAVLFTDLSSTPNGLIQSWKWNFDDGSMVTVNSPSNANVSHIFAAAGIYHVTLSIRTTTGCEASYTSSIKINPSPVTAFSYTNNCSDLNTVFTDLSHASGENNLIRWSWNFGDPYSGANNSSELKNPTHQFSRTGTYNITLTTENTLGCTSTEVRQIVAVTGKPTVDFVVPAACLNAPASFSVDPAATNIAEITSYLWDFGDGLPASTDAKTAHVYSQTGEYKVTLTITTLGGCKNSVTRTVQVLLPPVPQFTYSGNCASSPVKFTDISYNPAGERITAWDWDFGASMVSGDISSQQNPSYTYNSSGTYHVSLTITTESGCTASKDMPVTVMSAAEAKFSYTAMACNNGSVAFKDESRSTQSVITGWYWEFAPGVYSTLQNPTYSFGRSDTCYTVKLTVTTASGCSNTLVGQVCIPSGIDVNVNYTQACFGETTWFSSSPVSVSGVGIASYNWDFGDPATAYNNQSRLANPEHIFSKPGTYTVTLRATDINNCSASKYINVTVDDLPHSSFSSEGGACDSLVKFTVIPSGVKISRWIWKFGDGKSKIINSPSNPDINHFYTYPGAYQVTLISQSEAGCSDTITKTIRRTPCIAAAFKVSDPVVCVKQSLKFTEASTCQAPIASWTWYFGDNTSKTFTSPPKSVEHTYSVPGNYTVKMVVATQMVGGMVTDTASNNVSVKPAAKALYSWQNVCVGSSTTFDNLSQNNNTTIKSYLWNFGDPGSLTDTTSAKNASYSYGLHGEYTVKLVVTNTLGCTDTLVNKIKIFQSPEADFSWKNNCEAKPVYFKDQTLATSSALVNWNWKFSNDGEVIDGSNQRNCTFSFTKAGLYDADLTVTDKNGCSTVTRKQVTVHKNPVAAFSVIENYENKQGQVVISNGTINGTSYEWEISNGKTSIAPNPVITFDREGHYIIQLTARNDENCVDTLSVAYDLMYKGLYVPNAFNPGNINKEVAVFKPKGTNLKLYNIAIYDRWGNKLWSSSKINEKGSPAESWDGTWHGELLKQDVYVWKISAQFNDGEVWDGTNAGNNDNMPQQKAGTVTLIR